METIEKNEEVIFMIIGIAKIKLYAPWVHSLKEKRTEVRKLVDRSKNRFNISIAEVEDMDLHQSIVLGISCVSNSSSQVNSVLDSVITFIETNSEASIIDVEIEIL